MKKFYILVCLLAFSLPNILNAGIYGYLEGKVVDEDGKPMPGATISIPSIKKQYYSKEGGKFRISGLVASQYEVEVSFIGYKKYKTNVRISADATTTLDVKMNPEGGKTTQELTVTAQKMVENTGIGSITTMSGSEITQGGRVTTTNFVTTAAGVQAGGGGFVIRGSRASETQMRVDGRDVSNQFTGGFGALGSEYFPQMSSYATEEVQVLTGGFGAEYGDAMGGVVNSVARTGKSDRYEGFVSWRTDLPSLNGRQAAGLEVVRRGTDLVPVDAGEGLKFQGANENRLEFGFGGPLPGLDKSTFYFSTNNFFKENRNNNYEVYDPFGNNLGALPGNGSWVKNISGRIKIAEDDMLTITLGATYGVASLEGSGQGWIYAQDKGMDKDGNVINNMPEWQAKQNITNGINFDYWVRINQIFSETSFLEVNISMAGNKDQIGRRMSSNDPNFFTGFDVYQPVDNQSLIEGVFVEGRNKAIDWAETSDLPQGVTADGARKMAIPARNPITGYIEGQVNATRTNNAYGLTNFFNSHGTPGFNFRDSEYYQLDGTYTNLFETGEIKHTWKSGFEVRTLSMHRHYNENPYASNPSYDLYSDLWGGNIYSEGPLDYAATSKPMEPFRWSLNTTDQITYKGIILSAGFRLDYFNSNSRYRTYKDENGNFDPTFYSIDSINTNHFADSEAKITFSPRINVAYPLTPTSNIAINYSVLYRVPEYQVIYDGFNTSNLFNGNPLLGNPNINPQRTNAYEVNYSNQMTDMFMFKVTAYFKDIYNQLGLIYIPAVPNPFNQIDVTEYGNNRGLEFEFRKAVMNDYFGFRINYTYASIRGTSDGVNSNRGREKDPYIKDRDVIPLPLADFALGRDVTHRLNFILDFVWGNEQGPSIGDIYLLSNTRINVTGGYRSGFPYTKTQPDGSPLSDINSERNPGLLSMDMRITKTILMADIFGDDFSTTGRIDLYMDVNNFINRTVATNLNTATGDPLDNGVWLQRRIGSFTSDPLYKDVNYGISETFNSTQYDSFGNRLYSAQADHDNNGIVTQAEQYQSYINYIEQILKFRGNFQLPRTVYFGMAVVF